MRPLVVTLRTDAATQARFDRERAALFPTGRTRVGAHVTLFHALPGTELALVETALAAAVARPAFAVEVLAPYSLGRGVAYRLASPELDAVHAAVRAPLAAQLTRQDAQPFRPHVTVQNKVEPRQARETLSHLTAAWEPTTAAALGLRLWAYDGGPWEALREMPFEASPETPPETSPQPPSARGGGEATLP